MGKGTDKLYITHSEWANDFSEGGLAFGGASRANRTTGQGSGGFRRLPFYACALSLQPFKVPLATRAGCIFDQKNIQEWFITRGNINPVDGTVLKYEDLIPLTFHKNSDGAFYCPVTRKEFTDSSHIVTVAAGRGNVYNYEAIKELNIDARNWQDLLDEDVKFSRKHLVTIQDPKNLNNRNMEEFWYLKNNRAMQNPEEVKPKTNKSSLASRILSDLADTTLPKLPSLYSLDPSTNDPAPSGAGSQVTQKSTGRTAASFTSTSLKVRTETEAEVIDKNEVMYRQFCKEMMELRRNHKKGKLDMGHAYIKLRTTFGDLNLELSCVAAPRTCHNFILLCQRGYYDNVVFHRSIPKFMIQGGDPSGTGEGGESAWGKDFKDEIRPSMIHNARGLLSMANKGKNTNSSQFFFTFAPCKHLDGKHTIFGKVVGGLDVLAKMEQVDTGEKDRPVIDLRILGTTVYVNPFEQFEDRKERISRHAEKFKGSRAEQIRREGTWLGSNVSDEKNDDEQGRSGSPTIGKYIQKLDAASPHETRQRLPPPKNDQEFPPSKRLKQQYSISSTDNLRQANFDGW